MPPKGKSKRTPTKGKGRGRKNAVVPSPQPRRLIPIDESEKEEDLEEREKTAEPSPEELVEEKRQSEAAKKITKRTKKSCRLRDEQEEAQVLEWVRCLVILGPTLSRISSNISGDILRKLTKSFWSSRRSSVISWS